MTTQHGHTNDQLPQKNHIHPPIPLSRIPYPNLLRIQRKLMLLPAWILQHLTYHVILLPLALSRRSPTTENQNNNNSGISVSWQPQVHWIKQASTVKTKILGEVLKIQKEEITSSTKNCSHHALICDEIPPQYTLRESNTRSNHPQTDSSWNFVHRVHRN